MTTVLLLIGCVHFAGLLIVLVAATRAPYGTEDNEGFHQEAPIPVPVRSHR